MKFLFIIFISSFSFAQSNEVKLTDIEYAVPISNLKNGKNLIVSWLENNEPYIDSLYSIVSNYNKNNPGKSPIRLVVSVPDTYGPDSMFSNEQRPSGEPLNAYKKWKQKLSLKLKIKDSEPIPFLVGSLSKTTQNPWMQDLGEVFNFKIKNKSELVVGFLDTNYYGGTTGSDELKKMSDLLKFPVVNADNYLKDEISNDGDRGGNIEVTHENRLIVGSTISKKLLERLKTITKQEPIIVNTEFLMVGHLDEIISIVPAPNACGAAILYADPIYDLNIKLKNGKYPDEIESMRYFLKPSSISKIIVTLEDFDLLKKPRSAKELNEGDLLLINKLKAAKDIRDGVAKIIQSSKCAPPAVGLPVNISESPEYDFNGVYNTRSMVAFSNPINALALNGMIILEKPNHPEAVHKELTKIFGKNIYFLEEGLAFYSRNYGSVHCSTNVIRIP